MTHTEWKAEAAKLQVRATGLKKAVKHWSSAIAHLEKAAALGKQAAGIKNAATMRQEPAIPITGVTELQEKRARTLKDIAKLQARVTVLKAAACTTRGEVRREE